MTTTNELRQKSRSELERLAAEQRASIQNLRLKLDSRQSNKAHEMRAAKRELARTMTVLNEQKHV